MTILEEKLESAVKFLKLVYERAYELAREWFPDIEEYPQQRRIAVLSLMKMIIDLMRE